MIRKLLAVVLFLMCIVSASGNILFFIADGRTEYYGDPNRFLFEQAALLAEYPPAGTESQENANSGTQYSSLRLIVKYKDSGK